jgi:hypothetical protein
MVMDELARLCGGLVNRANLPATGAVIINRNHWRAMEQQAFPARGAQDRDGYGHPEP